MRSGRKRLPSMWSIQRVAQAALLCLPLPVEPKESWQPEIPLGVQGDPQRQAPLMCSPTKNVTLPRVLLFHIECERFTKRLISSLVQCVSLKASPFRGTPSKSQGPEGRQMRRLTGLNAVRCPLDHIRVFLSPLSTSSDWGCLQKEAGWVSAFFNSKRGLLYSRTGFGNYFSFFAFILG